MQPIYLLVGFASIIGLVIGSFLNVVALRYNTGLSLGGRSRCFSCRRDLYVTDLIPLFSYLFLAGRCRGCKTKISIQYPLVELVTALLYGMCTYWYLTGSISFAYFLLSLAFVSLSIPIAVYDLRHMIIPDGLVFALIGIGFLAQLVTGILAIDLISGFLIAFGFFSLWWWSGGAWMGFGDVKLSLAIGLFLSFPYNVYAIVYAFWIGALYGLGIMAFGKARRGRNTEIPFGPFLLLGVFFAYFFPVALW